MLVLPMSAHAIDWTWSWTGVDGMGADLSASGTFETNDLLSGSYQITEMTGTWKGASIKGLITAGGYLSNDNLLFDGNEQLTSAGVGFYTDVNNAKFYRPTLINYSGPTRYFWADSGGEDGPGGTFTATQVAAVPEPQTYALMLAGLALVGATARRRKAK